MGGVDGGTAVDDQRHDAEYHDSPIKLDLLDEHRFANGMVYFRLSRAGLMEVCRRPF